MEVVVQKSVEVGDGARSVGDGVVVKDGASVGAGVSIGTAS